MIYLDTSALAKLVVEELESARLARWLDDRPEEVLATSALTRVELLRAARRRSPETVPAAQSLLAELALVPVDGVVLDTAAGLDPPDLRSLEAVHLASAALLASTPDGLTFIAYDQRLAEAARTQGLDVATP